MCTKVVRHIRAVLFWIIYYWCALSEPSYYVLVKQFIAFLFSWRGGSIIANFVPNFVAMATGVDGRKCDWQHSMARFRKPHYRRKNLAKIFYANQVIANFVTNFVAMATGVGRGKMQLAAFDGPFPKTPYRRKNLPKISYASQVVANFVPNFVAMGTGVGRGKMQLAAFDGPPPKTPL